MQMHSTALYLSPLIALECPENLTDPEELVPIRHQYLSQNTMKIFGVNSDKLSWKPHLLKAINSCRPEVPETKDESRSKNFDLGRVSHLWFGFGKFLLKIANFSIFCPFGSKNISSGRIKARMASFLMWVKSMLGTKRNIDNTHLFVCLFVRPAITIVLFSTSFLSLRSLKTFMLPLCFPLE